MRNKKADAPRTLSDKLPKPYTNMYTVTLKEASSYQSNESHIIHTLNEIPSHKHAPHI